MGSPSTPSQFLNSDSERKGSTRGQKIGTRNTPPRSGRLACGSPVEIRANPGGFPPLVKNLAESIRNRSSSKESDRINKKFDPLVKNRTESIRNRSSSKETSSINTRSIL